MKLFLFTFVTGIDQIIFLEEYLWVSVSEITTNICLIKDWNKNIIGASITASTWKIILKDISKNKENFQKGFWSVYKFWSVYYKN